MTSAETLRAWLPPALHRTLGRWSGRSLRFTGGWSDWAGAASASTGYDDASILERVAHATRLVEAGCAAFERDSVTFAEWQPPFRLLAPLLRHALQHDGILDVVDYGGALGSSYRQCLPFLPPMKALRWQVIEQPGFVAAGQREFSTANLSFHGTLRELPSPVAPRFLLASSVLQYLPDPDQALNDWESSGVAAVLLDRTSVWNGKVHQAVVQHVPRHIYPASYPCWLLSRQALLKRMAANWRLLCDYECEEGHHVARGGPAFEFRGFLWERTS